MKTVTPLQGGKSAPSAPAAVLHRFRRGFRWEGVRLEPYKPRTDRRGEFHGASRQVLAGQTGEPINFHLRYFELDPGGFTSLERHHHCHVVIGARGSGTVRVGRRKFRIGPMDTIYIGPDQPHQLSATSRGRFGFFCIVDAVRDRPRPIDETQAVKPRGTRAGSAKPVSRKQKEGDPRRAALNSQHNPT